jgi:predicted transcriptional regulator
MLCASQVNGTYANILNKLKYGQNSEAVLEEIQEICKNCRPSSPIMCIELCEIWKLKREYHDEYAALHNKPNLIKLLKTAQNDRRQKILEILLEKPTSLLEIYEKLKTTDSPLSLNQARDKHLQPLLDVSLIHQEDEHYYITPTGKNIYNILTNSELDKYPLHSNGNDEEVLRALYSNPQTYNELTEVIPKNAVYRSLNRLKEQGLIVKSEFSGRVVYFATKRRPTRKLSPIESQIFKALIKEALPVKDISEKVGISVRRVYEYLKQLRYKQHIAKEEKPILWKITEKGKAIAESLNIAYNMLQQGMT